MRSSKEKDKLLVALEEASFVDRACRKVGIHRSTYYRWYEEDKSFRAKAKKAMALGREILCELSESMLMKKIKDGEIQAIKFYLQNNSPIYIPKRSIYVIPPKDVFNPQEGCDACGYKPMSKEEADRIKKAMNTFFNGNKSIEGPDDPEED